MITSESETQGQGYRAHDLETIVAPSLLSADFMNLRDDCTNMIGIGIQRFHIDVMDGHFVPNLSFGSGIVKQVRRAFPNVFLDCHLMTTNPRRWLPGVLDAGVNQITFHVEANISEGALVSASDPIAEFIKDVRDHGCRCGLALSPATAASVVRPYLASIDQVIVMTVEPGFGGQKMKPECLGKVSEIRRWDPKIDIEVDGGINEHTVEAARKAGANVFVIGALFRTPHGDRQAYLDSFWRKASDGG